MSLPGSSYQRGIRTGVPAGDTGKEMCVCVCDCAAPSNGESKAVEQVKWKNRQEERQGKEEVARSGWWREKLDCALS